MARTKAQDDDGEVKPLSNAHVAASAPRLCRRALALPARAASCFSSSPVCKATLGCVIIAALVLTGGVASPRRGGSGGAALAAPCAVFVNVYIDLSRRALETPFVLNSVLDAAALRGACGACPRLRPYSQFFGDLRAGLLDCTAAVVGFSGNGDGSALLAALSERPRAASERVVLLYFSDEFGGSDARSYPLVRTVFRNYDEVREDRVADVGYLAGNGTAPPSRLLWLPIGTTAAFLHAPAFALPTRAREWAWAWAGDGFGKPARKAFLAALGRSMPDAVHLGQLKAYDGFYAQTARDGGSYGGVALDPVEYSYWLHNARLAPCPDGGSAEQFRVWEALVAGAVPIVSRGALHLRYLATLDFRVFDVAKWDSDEAPALLRAAADDQRFVRQVAAMQEHNAARLASVNDALHARVAAELCAAAGAPCAAVGGVPCPLTARAQAASNADCLASRDGGIDTTEGGNAPKR